MSEFSHESTANQPIRSNDSDKDVESLARDIKELTPLTQTKTEKGKQSGVRRKLFESEREIKKETPSHSLLKNEIAKIKESFQVEEEPDVLTDKEIKELINPYFKDKSVTELKFLFAKMLEERKSKGKELTLKDLKEPGIYYLKLHQDVPFPDPPNTTIPCHYVGLSTNVYGRIQKHISRSKKTSAIGRQLRNHPPTKKEWTLRVVMLKEIPVDKIKELQAIKGNVVKLLNVLETIAIMEMKSLYPNGYNIRLDMPRSMTYVDYKFTFKEN